MPAEDVDFEEWAARFTEGFENGEIEVPAEADQQPMWFSVAGTDDPRALESEAFAQHGPLDEAAPGALLAAQAAGFAGDTAALGSMSDNALLGLVAAGRKLAARGAAVQQRAIAEYAARRQPTGPRASRKGFREFSADELAWQLAVNHNQAEAAMDQAATSLRSVPKVSGLLWDGKITDYQLSIIASGTRFLDPEGATEADAILAGQVAGLTPGQTRALVRRVVLMIDPEAAKERKKDAAKRARVEKFQELSGTAALSGRDLPPAAVLAGYQHIDSQARAMQAAGYEADLERLRAAVYLSLVTGRDVDTMLMMLSTEAGDATPGTGTRGRWPWNQPHEPESNQDRNGQDSQAERDDASGQDNKGLEDGEGNGGSRRPGPQDPNAPHGPTGGDLGTIGSEGTGAAPFAAVINLLVPAGTLLGTGTAPGEIPGYGPVDPETTRDLVQMASAHPQTRWCITTVGDDGAAKEHGCARGQHRWTPPAAHRTGGGNRDGPDSSPEPIQPGPGDDPQTTAAGFLDRLSVKLALIAAGQEDCDHTYCTDRYHVPQKLKHLIKARKATCVAPNCNRPAADADADHTIPWPQGPTCQDNLGAPCRYHHRNKQADGWRLLQSTPGTFEWTSPSGRTATTNPQTYTT